MNSLCIIGRLGNDPRTFGNGDIAKFTVATQDGQYTNWVPVTCFGKLAETCAQYLHKGRQVSVEARVQQTSYDRDGQTIYAVEVIATSVTFLDSKTQATPEAEVEVEAEAEVEVEVEVEVEAEIEVEATPPAKKKTPRKRKTRAKAAAAS